jgi:uncharacterized membrane protein
MANKTSQHILGTAANLLGFCLIIITSVHLANKAAGTLIDELTSVVALILTVSSVFSFLALRSENKERDYKLEQIADYLFMGSLLGIFGIIAFITLVYWGM